MPSTVKNLEYIKCYNLSSHRPVKNVPVLPDTTARRSSVDLEDLKAYWKSENRPYVSRWLKGLLFNLSQTLLRPIIVNFSFIVISCTWSLMLPGAIIWLFGKTFEKITTLCFALSLYDKINKLGSNNQLSCGILRKILRCGHMTMNE